VTWWMPVISSRTSKSSNPRRDCLHAQAANVDEQRDAGGHRHLRRGQDLTTTWRLAAYEAIIAGGSETMSLDPIVTIARWRPEFPIPRTAARYPARRRQGSSKWGHASTATTRGFDAPTAVAGPSDEMRAQSQRGQMAA